MNDEELKRYQANFKKHYDSVKDRIPKLICKECVKSEPTKIEDHTVDICYDYFECVLDYHRVWWTPKDKTLCEGCNFGYTRAEEYPKKMHCSRHSEPCTLNHLYEESEKDEKNE